MLLTTLPSIAAAAAQSSDAAVSDPILTGYDADRPIENLTFQNLSVNGTVVHTTPKSGPTAQTDGLTGVRINHQLDVQVDGFAVQSMS